MASSLFCHSEEYSDEESRPSFPEQKGKGRDSSPPSAAQNDRKEVSGSLLNCSLTPLGSPYASKGSCHGFAVTERIRNQRFYATFCVSPIPSTVLACRLGCCAPVGHAQQRSHLSVRSVQNNAPRKPWLSALCTRSEAEKAVTALP